MSLSWQQSIGIEESHLVTFKDVSQNSVLVNTQVVEPLTQLLEKAEKDGVTISIISAFRSFSRQLAIWNDKWSGYKPVYSRQGRPLNILQMSDIEKYKAIALWSALPGLSRHHWGTDFDIFAYKPITTGYLVELTPSEFAADGPCGELEHWLTENLEQLGFFRPYQKYQRGVSLEPWHISHINYSQSIFEAFDKQACRDYLAKAEIKSHQFINEQFEHYYTQYFCNFCGVDK